MRGPAVPGQLVALPGPGLSLPTVTGEAGGTDSGAGRIVVAYTLGRLAVFGAVALLLAVAGLRGLLLVMVALVLSAVASGVLLRGQRNRLVASLAARRERSLSRRTQEQQVRDHVQEVRRQQARGNDPPPDR